jgi:hypothetical protein
MGNIQNIAVGVCSVEWKGSDLGHTKEGVMVRIENSFEDLTVDQYGTTPVNMVLTGTRAEVETALAEDTFQVLQRAITFSDPLSGVNGNRLQVGANAGQLYGTKAGLLRLHPIALPASDKSQDWVFYLSVPKSDGVELAYKVDEQRVIPVTFTALVDESKVEGNRLGHRGVDSVS